MPPPLDLGVMHRALSPRAFRARELRALGEVDPQIQALLLGVELDIAHPPRRLKTKRALKQIHIVHVGLQSSRTKPGKLSGRPDGNPHEMTRGPTSLTSGLPTTDARVGTGGRKAVPSETVLTSPA